MTDLRCWQCSVEPTGLAEVTRIQDAEPRYIPTGWPPGDHEHSVTPPSPEQLTSAAYAAGQRILAGWVTDTRHC